METQVKADDVSTLKSPRRILVRFFRRSRDNWKRKFMDLKTEIKRFKNQAADARRSREQWRTKAESFQAEVRRLEAELAELRARQAADKKRRR
jgi:predicted  nucleic acid-binding Zn-ribbon protein